MKIDHIYGPLRDPDQTVTTTQNQNGGATVYTIYLENYQEFDVRIKLNFLEKATATSQVKEQEQKPRI